MLHNILVLFIDKLSLEHFRQSIIFKSSSLFLKLFCLWQIYLIVIATIHAKIPTSLRGFHSSNGTFAIYLASPKEESGANQKNYATCLLHAAGHPKVLRTS